MIIPEVMEKFYDVENTIRNLIEVKCRYRLIDQ